MRTTALSGWGPTARSRVGRAAVATAAGAALALGVGGSALAGSLPAASSAAGRAAPSAGVAFVPIREVFDGDRIARPRDVTVACKGDVSTLAIVTCADDRTENTDVTIDKVERRRFAASTPSGRTAINRDDRAWLANRVPVCVAGYQSPDGGTIVEILEAICQTDVSAARLDAVKGVPVPTASLVATDDTDPDDTQYATAGGGTRIGAIDTQGDETGGVIIAWVVIAGYRGFTVTPSSFPYIDGAFTDPGIVAGHPAGHHITAGHEYTFDIDYSTLSHDPGRTSGKGRFEYRSAGHAVGAWS